MSSRATRPALDRDMVAASDEQLLRVVGLIDRLDHRGDVDGLLGPVRDRLALLRPARPLTLGRVLVLPFEDLLVPAGEAWPNRWCFPRERLAELIGQVTASLPGSMLAGLRARAAGQSMISAEIVQEIGAALWPAAAVIVADRAADGGTAPDLAAQLAGIAPLLTLAPTLVPTVWELPPRPMGALPKPAVTLLLEPLRLAVPLGEIALQAVLELFLLRAANPLVMLEPLRFAEFGLAAGAREALLHRLVQRRIADMREGTARLAAAAARPGGRPDAALLLRLVAELEALDGRWPLDATARSELAGIRDTVTTCVGRGIETAVRDGILDQLGRIEASDALGDDGLERLEEVARHTRRLGLAGARLGLAATPDSLLAPYLQPFRDVIGKSGGSARTTGAGLIEQIRVAELLFGSDVAMQLYHAQREAGGRAAS